MTLSRRTKESIKTALAMIIVYGIALSMDWDRPYWAGFAVAFCSLDTVGQSMNKAAMRMLGTVLAAVVALTLIALFPQERWLFMVGLSAYVGICAYMMSISQRVYFWQVSAFVCAVIAFDAGPSSENAFQIAVLRLEQTGLGVLVYGLVTTLLWKVDTGADFETAVRKLASTRRQIYLSYLNLSQDEGNPADLKHLREQWVQQRTQIDGLLAAASTDTYEVWERRRLWHHYRRQTMQLDETLERWHQSFAEIRVLDLPRLIPNVAALETELDFRFTQIDRMLAGQAPEKQPTVIDLSRDPDAVRTLNHFNKAVFAITWNRLLRLEALTRSLFETVQDLKGFARSNEQPATTDESDQVFAIDLDGAAAAVRLLAGFWVAYLIWIYTLVPGGAGFPSLVISFGLMFVASPRMPVSATFAPFAVGIAFASILYIFMMPKLASFTGLGLMIFASTFAICYLFYTPRQQGSRAIGLLTFVLVIGVSNQQTYDFLNVANVAVEIALICTVLWLAAYVPVSPQPEKAFLRLLGRYFRSCDYLVSQSSVVRPGAHHPPTMLERWRRSFHAYEAATLPKKLGDWSKAIAPQKLPGTQPEQLREVVTNLQNLAYRMHELLVTREYPQAEPLVQELFTDIQAWRERIQNLFHRISREPATESADNLREGLTSRLTQLETQIESAVNKAAGTLQEQDAINFYRLLGAYRGVSEAAINYVEASDGVDWIRWRETRF